MKIKKIIITTGFFLLAGLSLFSIGAQTTYAQAADQCGNVDGEHNFCSVEISRDDGNTNGNGLSCEYSCKYYPSLGRFGYQCDAGQCPSGFNEGTCQGRDTAGGRCEDLAWTCLPCRNRSRACYRIVAPTSTPIPTSTPVPTDTPVPTSTPVPTATPTTVPPTATLTPRPECSRPCTTSAECELGDAQCQLCAPLVPGGGKVCRSGRSQCGGYCDGLISCAGDDQCICDSNQHKCVKPPETPTSVPPTSVPPTNVPTSTPVPTATPTPGQCQPGVTQCSCSGSGATSCAQCDGGWCNGGVCQQCQFTSTQPGECTTGPTGRRCGCEPGDEECESSACAFSTAPAGSKGICRDLDNTRGSDYRCMSCATGPVSTPVPTATPVPPTALPTAVQPTIEITMIATPTPNPARAVSRAGQPLPSQRWVCLKAEPCSSSASGCSGNGTPDHRVKLSIKTDIGDAAKPLPGKPTYVFECLQTATGNRCTTGDLALDRAILGSSALPELQVQPPNGPGYEVNSDYGPMFENDGLIEAVNPVPASNNNNGNIGVKEWESYTAANTNRMFLAMNEFSGTGIDGVVGGQQQGSFSFVPGGSKKCVQIQWDPVGTITDKWTLKPLDNAQVSLFKKHEDGAFKIVTNDDILGGIQNPYKTNKDGVYNFYVPDGIYKVEVSKEGYERYESKDIEQVNGKVQTHDVSLEPKRPSLLESIETYIKELLK